MAVSPFVVREIASRRLQRITPIPWAEPAPVAAVPYTAYLGVKQLRRSDSKRKRLDVELNSYPDTPTGYYSGFYPGSDLSRSNKVTRKVTRQDLPELDQFTESQAGYLSGYFPGSELQKANRTRFKREHLKNQELNTYPDTPTGYYEGYYPGSSLSKSNKILFKRDHLTNLELDSYPATPVPDQPLPAFIEPKTNRRHQKQYLRKNLELNERPQPVISDAVIPAFYSTREIVRRRRKVKLLTVQDTLFTVEQVQLDPGLLIKMYPSPKSRTMTPSPKNRNMVVNRG